jgi:hypothetical protein
MDTMYLQILQSLAGIVFTNLLVQHANRMILEYCNALPSYDKSTQLEFKMVVAQKSFPPCAPASPHAFVDVGFSMHSGMWSVDASDQFGWAALKVTVFTIPEHIQKTRTRTIENAKRKPFSLVYLTIWSTIALSTHGRLFVPGALVL